jgi:cation:H+ antiporter
LADFLVPSLLILVGFIVLIAGGEVLVRGASGMARAMHISPLIIGLTVVAFCTSCPELAVCLKAAFAGKADFAVGNIVGSCICNILFVLGLAALVGALVVRARLVWLEVPLMILAAVLTLVFGLDGTIGRIDGLIFVAFLIGYMTWTVIASRRESKAVKEELSKLAGAEVKTGWLGVLGFFSLVVVGVVLLVVASSWLVDGAVEIARLLGVSELMIGLTILAIGTSLPEAATCVIASLRNERDIAVGNVVGSNIMNILAVLGMSAVIAPEGIGVSETALHIDIPVMIIVSFACLPIFFTGHRIERWEGGLFLAYYVVYLVYLILGETNTVAARQFGMVIGVFVIPLTVVTLLVLLLRSLKPPVEAEGENE